MTGTTPAPAVPGLHLPRYLREEAAARTPVGFAEYRSTALRAPLRTPVDLPHRLTEVTGPVLGEDRVLPT
ncbi:Protocatechuate 3,4-dioxygenase beta subunit N terminal, partial [Geodermatophilus aquaeductus]